MIRLTAILPLLDGEKAVQVHVPHAVISIKSNVRRGDDMRVADEFLVFRKVLLMFQYIQERMGDFSALERVQQRGGVDKRSACGVYKDHTVFHGVESGGIDHVMRFFAGRKMQRDDVALA